MKKIAIKVVALTLIILSLIYLYKLQFKRDMVIVNSIILASSNYKNERITVILNKLIVDDNKEKIAENIIQKIISNDFHTIKFNFDNGYPNELNVSVYKTKNDIKTNNILFLFSYKQEKGEIGEYNISQQEKMKLEIKKHN